MTSSFSLQFLMHFFLRSSCFQTSTTTTTIKNGEPCEKSLPLQELTNRQQHFTSWIYPILCFSEVSLFSIHISRLSCKQSYNWFALNHVDSNSFTTNEWRERERERKRRSLDLLKVSTINQVAKSTGGFKISESFRLILSRVRFRTRRSNMVIGWLKWQ